MFEISPTLVRYDIVEPSTASSAHGIQSLSELAKSAGQVSGEPLRKPIDNFYQTDPVSRASPTMAKATQVSVGVNDQSSALQHFCLRIFWLRCLRWLFISSPKQAFVHRLPMDQVEPQSVGSLSSFG